MFDQESCITLQKGSGKPPVTSTSEPHPNRIPNQQELKMQVGGSNGIGTSRTLGRGELGDFVRTS